MPEQLTQELTELRDRIEIFVEADLRPLEEQLDAGTLDEATVRQRVIERSRDLGFFGMTQPSEVGGTEAGPLALTVARETLAAGNLRITRSVFGPGPGILARSEGLLRERYMEPLIRGEVRNAFAFTESSDGSARTSARRDGDDFIVNGRKSFVSGGSAADFYSVLVNVEEGDGPGGPAMLIVDHDAPGLTREDDFVSLDGGTHCAMNFDEMRVPQTHVIGEVGQGMPRAMGNIGRERLQIAAQASGTAMWVVEHTREHISKPHRSGTSLGEREQVRAVFGQMMLETYAIRSTLYRTARLADDDVDIMNEGAIAKVFAAEAAGRVVDAAIQLGGGEALIEGHPLERLYRVSRSWRLAGGSSDVLRFNIARGKLEFEAGRV
ncbi:MAG TPA: acyl-CoA dehydrogenase family protein [Dehalococcoidia bacterium]|nr:acyl-CoA dehydrogenase family protein [Dehalococcoidia bacterium]